MNLRLTALLILLPTSAAMAASSTTANLAVSAKVLSGSTCSVTAPAVTFGEFTAGEANKIANLGIGVTCPQGVPYQISLNGGEHYDADSGTRMMVSGADGIAYSLFHGGNQWGDGASYPAGQPRNGIGSGQGTPFFGTAQVFTNAQTPAGNYSDNVLVTVSY